MAWAYKWVETMKSDIFSGLAIVVFGGALLLVAIPSGVVEYGSSQNLAMSPSFWPKVLAISLMVLGLGVMLEKRLGANKGNCGKENLDSSSAQEGDVSSGVQWRGMIALLMIPLYYLSILWFGLVVPSFLAFLVYSLCHSSKKLGSSMLWGIVVVICVTVFFVKGADIVIPMGPVEAFL